MFKSLLFRFIQNTVRARWNASWVCAFSLFFPVLLALPFGARADLKPPIVGDYLYTSERCNGTYGPYATEADAANYGAALAYSNRVCSIVSSLPRAPWPTKGQATFGCWAAELLPAFRYGVESSNSRAYSVTYIATTDGGCSSTYVDGLTVRRSRSVECPEGYVWIEQLAACVPVVDTDRVNARPKSCPVGNPIFALQGTKRQNEITGMSAGKLGLSFHYGNLRAGGTIGYATGVVSTSYTPIRPANPSAMTLGASWTHSFDRRVLVQGGAWGALVSRGNGEVISFTGDGAGNWVPDPDVNDRLTSMPNGEFVFQDSAGFALERFDLNGKLIGVYPYDGSAVLFTYSTNLTPPEMAPASGLLLGALDSYGRGVAFKYEKPQGASRPRLFEVNDSSGAALAVEFDSLQNLSALRWADGSVREYKYELASLPWALTGIVDESQNRYATYAYSSDGMATETSLAGQANRFLTAYSTAPKFQLDEYYDSSRQVLYRIHSWNVPSGIQLTIPSGQVVSWSANRINGKLYLSSQTQPAGSGCAASTSGQSFDVNGNVTQRDDFNGGRVCYAYNSTRNLEASRVEGLVSSAACSAVLTSGASLPPGGRKVSTQWHPDWRVETKIAEPGRITTSVYNGQPDPFANGQTASCAPSGALLPDGKPIVVLCKKVEQATTDANGALGFAAPLQASVPARTWQYSYNEYGQVLTVMDSLNRVTSYAYYADTTATHTKGDLQSVTNPLGHVTSYVSYNSSGQVLRIEDANGVGTDYSYDVRQRLTSVAMDGSATTYAYWPTGLLKSVTHPDQSAVTYEYDAAHRLTAVADSAGNRIEYVLDNSGNRVAEAIKDPNGTLAKQISRVMDALGRTQQVTGRE